MYHDSRESWTDALFWGVTITLGMLAVGAAAMVYFNWWVPFGR